MEDSTSSHSVEHMEREKPKILWRKSEYYHHDQIQLHFVTSHSVEEGLPKRARSIIDFITIMYRWWEKLSVLFLLSLLYITQHHLSADTILLKIYCFKIYSIISWKAYEGQSNAETPTFWTMKCTMSCGEGQKGKGVPLRKSSLTEKSFVMPIEQIDTNHCCG